jgi:hypothetical protein
MQLITDRFAAAADKYGLSISRKKTEVMYHPSPGKPYIELVINIGGTRLKPVTEFCFLGSTLSNDALIDKDVTTRISRACVSFGRLSERVWKQRGIKTQIKLKVYRVVVLSNLLYGCETWTCYRRHIQQLDIFHMQHLRALLGIKWQDKVTNNEVLERCTTTGIEAMLITAQLRWAGHVMRMDDTRMPKQLLYGELKEHTWWTKKAFQGLAEAQHEAMWYRH